MMSFNCCRPKLIWFWLTITVALGTAGCGRDTSNGTGSAPTKLSQVSAVRLNFRYEPDVPGPGDEVKAGPTDERNAAIQADFDQNRPQEILDRSLTSSDKKRVIVVYHRATDLASEFRLDIYTPDGKLLRKITPDSMAVHFPDTILWAPDSSAVAFVAMVRAGQDEGNAAPPAPDAGITSPAEPDANSNTVPVPTISQAAPEPPAVITFRTEQIYLCDADGDKLRPITQSEGKIYFYYVWSPDSTRLAAMVATQPEWRAMFGQAEGKGEIFVPAGRPRIVEKNGRERLLDDALTQVHPVWSPDSSKVAAAFDTQIRIYDAVGTTPTQAAIPLRNQLLISSQAYDQELQRKAAAENSVVNANAQSAPPDNAAPGTTTLPDPATLVSFSPIIELEWTADDLLYFQTGYVKQYKNPADNRRSYVRWHRLVLTPQPADAAR